MPSPFPGGRIRNVDHLAFFKAMLVQDMSVGGGGGGGGGVASWCSLLECQALHPFAVVCTAGQGQHRARASPTMSCPFQ